MNEFTDFCDWYTNYFIEINTDPANLIDPRNIEGIEKLGEISTNETNNNWRLKSKMPEKELHHSLSKILRSQTKIDPKTEMILTKGIDGGPMPIS
ncbi:hypothetical protein [Companilactobacillus hulinensis]|uniref:hypothetical protein n=1 Tax=Companilactobacillus hulinensis TaxID=2486007 RepID=UPI000F76DF76|nr:hypothetical protein [Companilactobacillus hulinensis]